MLFLSQQQKEGNPNLEVEIMLPSEEKVEALMREPTWMDRFKNPFLHGTCGQK
jgi:hypothetical protein